MEWIIHDITIAVLIASVTAQANITNTSNYSIGHEEDYYAVDPMDYYYGQDYSNFVEEEEVCTSKVLAASSKAKILTPRSEKESDQDMENSWTIIPSNKGGVVAVVMKEYTFGTEFFSQDCQDIEIFAAELNSTISWPTTSQWCKKERVLSCEMSKEIMFYLGITELTSKPGGALHVQYPILPPSYDYAGNNRAFQIYYYECGGRRSSGYIRSPRFHTDNGLYLGYVRCKWDVVVNKGEYGILRFSSFNLPNCSAHYLIIEEDTLIPEGDVTDNLLARLQMRISRGSRSLQEGFGNETDKVEDAEGSTDEVEQNERKYTVFYQESKQAKTNDSEQPSKSGIHAIVVTKYCGDNIPPRTLYWRRASKNVSLTFISENLTSSRQGFDVKYSGFSWKDMKDQAGLDMPNLPTWFKRETTVLDIFLNYIIIIVFVPIGVTIGFTIIIVQIRRSGPSLRDFYRKEKKEMKRLQRLKEALAEYPEQEGRRSVAQRSRSFDFPRRFRRNFEIPGGNKQKQAVAYTLRLPRRNTIQIGSPAQKERSNRREEHRMHVENNNLSECSSVEEEEAHSLIENK